MELIMRRSAINAGGTLLRTIGNGGFSETLRSTRYLCQFNDKKWNKRIYENSISRRSMDRLSWPESNTICIFNRHQIHGLMYKKTNCVSYYSTTQSNDSTKVDSTSEPPKKLSIIQKMKQLYKDYWRILVPVHIVTSIGWVGIFWIAAKNGVDIIKIMEYIHLSEKYIDLIKNSNAGDYAVTYALYKIFTPLRYTVTVGGTTLMIKTLGYQKSKRRAAEATSSSNKSSSQPAKTSSETTSSKGLAENQQRKN